jgi:hypothetical protein
MSFFFVFVSDEKNLRAMRGGARFLLIKHARWGAIAVNIILYGPGLMPRWLYPVVHRKCTRRNLMKLFTKKQGLSKNELRALSELGIVRNQYIPDSDNCSWYLADFYDISSVRVRVLTENDLMSVPKYEVDALGSVVHQKVFVVYDENNPFYGFTSGGRGSCIIDPYHSGKKKTYLSIADGVKESVSASTKITAILVLEKTFTVNDFTFSNSTSDDIHLFCEGPRCAITVYKVKPKTFDFEAWQQEALRTQAREADIRQTYDLPDLVRQSKRKFVIR